MKSAYLRLVDADNHNREFKMIQVSQGVFTGMMNRVGAAPLKRSYPMSRWDQVYAEKIRKGYIDVTGLHEKTCSYRFSEIGDPKVREFFGKIEGYSSMALRDNYLESYDKVTGEMLDQASAVLTGIRKDMDKDEINSALLELFRIIPRKMQSVSDYLLHDEALLDEILLREWDLLRVMEARAAACGEETLPGQTVLEHMGLDIRSASPGELRTIKKLLTRESAGRLEYAYCVRNKHTDKRFYSWMDKNGYSEHDIHYLFHGSRNENWYGLMKSGPLLMPKGVVITGKAFGNGIYFANRAKKSIGYTSLKDACWTDGRSDTGFIAIYKVLFKNPKHVNRYGNYSLRGIRPHDAVFAHRGLDLKNDEIIVFRQDQVTLKYILEIR